MGTSTTIDVSPVLAGLTRKAAETGSNGYFASGKVQQGSDRFQVTVGSWLVKSKETHNTPKAEPAEVSQLIANLPLVPKEMKGKPGFYAGGKVITSAGDILQTNVICTKVVGS